MKDNQPKSCKIHLIKKRIILNKRLDTPARSKNKNQFIKFFKRKV